MASIQRFYIIAGDRLPSIKLNITRESTSAAYDLTGHTSPKFSMRNERDSDSVVDGKTAVIESPTTGGVMRYDWGTSETNTPGKYKGQFHAIDASSRPVTFPNNSYIEIHVLPSLKT